jgi:hypothetical protein
MKRLIRLLGLGVFWILGAQAAQACSCDAISPSVGFDRAHLFFAILAKGGRDAFYHPQVCNWTRPLQSSRVVTKDNESLWVEDVIAREHGPGEPAGEQH